MEHILLVSLWVLFAMPSCGSVRPEDKGISIMSDGHFLGSPRRAYGIKDSTGGFNSQEAAAYWGTDATNEVSQCIANEISALANAEGYHSIADYGAGLGGYGLYFKGKGIAEVHCYDANPEVAETSKGLCQTVDLGRLQPRLPKVDLAITLEVGEHIPKQFEQNFLDNLASAGTKAIVVSWAHPLQGGTRHVNERSQGYVADQIRHRGYGLDRPWTLALRRAARNCPQWYFVTNPMVFKKRAANDGYWYESWCDYFWLSNLCWLGVNSTAEMMHGILGDNLYRVSGYLFLLLLLVLFFGSVAIGLRAARTKSAGR